MRMKQAQKKSGSLIRPVLCLDGKQSLARIYNFFYQIEYFLGSIGES